MWIQVSLNTCKDYKNLVDCNCMFCTDVSEQVFDICLQRKTVITGSVEPNDEECDWPSDDEKEDEQLSVKNPAVNTYTTCSLFLFLSLDRRWKLGLYN